MEERCFYSICPDHGFVADNKNKTHCGVFIEEKECGCDFCRESDHKVYCKKKLELTSGKHDVEYVWGCLESDGFRLVISPPQNEKDMEDFGEASVGLYSVCKKCGERITEKKGKLKVSFEFEK